MNPLKSDNIRITPGHTKSRICKVKVQKNRFNTTTEIDFVRSSRRFCLTHCWCLTSSSDENQAHVSFLLNPRIHEVVDLAINLSSKIKTVDIEVRCGSFHAITNAMPTTQWEQGFTFDLEEGQDIVFNLFITSMARGRALVGTAAFDGNEMLTCTWTQKSLQIQNTKDHGYCGTLHISCQQEEAFDEAKGQRPATIFIPQVENGTDILKPFKAITDKHGNIELLEDVNFLRALGRFPKSPVAVGPCLQPLNYKPQTDCRIRATPVAFTTQKLDTMI